MIVRRQSRGGDGSLQRWFDCDTDSDWDTDIGAKKNPEPLVVRGFERLT